MASTAPNESILTESTAHSAPWYRTHPRATHLTPQICNFFQSYTGVADEDLDAHILDIREQAWKIRPYPCVGSFDFLDFSLRELPDYTSWLDLLRSGDWVFVDLGCCFGQNLRWLANEGVPTHNMIPLDLMPDFWELSFDLFRDKEKMHAKFVEYDLLSENKSEDLRLLEGKADILFAGYLFHLFDWQGQVKVASKAVSWSKGAGSVICGEMIGKVEAEEKLSGWGKSGTTHFWQNEQSWRRLWKEVEENTNTKWGVWIDAVKTSVFGDRYKYMGDTTIKVRFVCTRIS